MQNKTIPIEGPMNSWDLTTMCVITSHSNPCLILGFLWLEKSKGRHFEFNPAVDVAINHHAILITGGGVAVKSPIVLCDPLDRK